MTFEGFVSQLNMTNDEVEELWDYLQLVRARKARRYIAGLLRKRKRTRN